MSKEVDSSSRVSYPNESLTLEPTDSPNETGFPDRVFYQYSPLREAQDIRLLTLLPGAFDAEIRLCLENTPFTADNVPKFEALSYAWGTDKNPVDIFVAPSENESLAVTQNLAEALAHLRHENQPRVLWIDAICVNQRDVDERSSQVRRMADIYSKATRVVVWLGPESADTSIAMDYVELVVSKVEVNWTAGEMRPLSDETHWEDSMTVVPISRAEARALASLFGHSWFYRLWIWQEIRLGSQASIILWGTQSILFSRVRTCVFFLYAKLKPHIISSRFKEDIDDVFRLCYYDIAHPCERFDTMLIRTEKCKYTDPRDKVFALLYLIPENERWILPEPDYSKTVAEIYKDTFIRSTQFYQTLGLMMYMESHSPRVDLPSWVPDWSLTATTSEFLYGYASGRTAIVIDQTTVELMENGILQVAGVSIATLEHIEPFKFRNDQRYWSTSRADIIRIASIFEFRNAFAHENGLRELCKAACMGMLSEKFYPARTGYPNLEKGIEILSHALSNQFEEGSLLSDDEIIFWRIVADLCEGRTLFLSTEGHIGLGPVTAKAGDLVTVLLGCRIPMVIRKRKDGRYQVIGAAYCNGIMDGEALLGPLSEPYKMIFRIQPTTGIDYRSCMNTINGDFQGEDVRLGPLPDGWRTKEHAEEMFYQVFVDEDQNETLDDPRLTPEALKERGIDIQVFDLI